ncbi:MAG: M48 family metalloprotease [Geminicoccaceae bacterium]
MLTGSKRGYFRFGMALALIAGLALSPPPARAADGVRLIRDAEIEQTLWRVTGPILDAAGLDRSGVKIYIVQDSTLNAFVAGGMNLFLNTGLLMRTENMDQLAGVIAHEVGHMAGGHLSRVGPAQERAAAEMILAAVLGAAAAVAGSSPELGAAIITGGQRYAQGQFMRFSRGQEQAADQAAITYLNRLGISPRGLAEFFHVIENENVLSISISPYLRSHPLTRDRITFVENQVAQSAGRKDSGLMDQLAGAHARMVAKLKAFLNDPRQVLDEYRDDDSLVGRYARAIAHYRLPDLDRALKEIDALIAEHPKDPFFHELKGQMLFENGRIEDAVGAYREAVALLPHSALLHVALARAMIESGDEAENHQAIGQLEVALRNESTNAGAWRLLGIAQGRDGLEGRSSLSLAESALLLGNRDDARLYAKRAESRIEPSDPAWLRLQDILRVIEQS